MNITTIVIIITLVYFIVKWIENTHKSYKTGEYRQATTSKDIRKKLYERWAIENKYPKQDRHDPNTQLYKELEALKEKWAEPGTKAFEEIEEKKEMWKNGKRW